MRKFIKCNDDNPSTWKKENHILKRNPPSNLDETHIHQCPTLVKIGRGTFWAGLVYHLYHLSHQTNLLLNWKKPPNLQSPTGFLQINAIHGSPEADKNLGEKVVQHKIRFTDFNQMTWNDWSNVVKTMPWTYHPFSWEWEVYTTYNFMVMTGGWFITVLPTLTDIKLWFIPFIPPINLWDNYGHNLWHCFTQIIPFWGSVLEVAHMGIRWNKNQQILGWFFEFIPY